MRSSQPLARAARVSVATETPPNARTLLWVCVGALLAVGAGELFFRAIAELRPPLLEAEDGIAWFRDHDPTTVVLGSSHARAFLPLSDMLAGEATQRPDAHRERVAVISLEYGTLTSYRWLVTNKLVPLMEARTADGSRVRPSLARAILVTDWWDACGRAQGPASTNLPARVWDLTDFIHDLAGHGLTDYNANYLQARLDRWLRFSVLVRSRGHEHLVNALKQLVKKKSDAERRADLEGAIDAWRDMVEAGAGCEDPVQRQALDDLVNLFESHGAEVTVLLYPRMPSTISDRAKAVTLDPFSQWAREYAARKGVRFVDLSLGTPMTDDDWESDLDHVTATGAQKFSEWVLAGPLAFLREAPPAPPQVRPAAHAEAGGGA